MQDRYAGDIGDFEKFGLLRYVENEGLSVGVNWYLIKPINEIESNKNDGKHEIKDKFKKCDIELFNKLKNVFSGKRNVKNIEIKKLLKTDIYYSKLINIDDRDAWHDEALNTLSNCDVVFLDPDNRLKGIDIKPFSISFHRGTVRDYIVLANGKHKVKLLDACTKMLKSE